MAAPRALLTAAVVALAAPYGTASKQGAAPLRLSLKRAKHLVPMTEVLGAPNNNGSDSTPPALRQLAARHLSRVSAPLEHGRRVQDTAPLYGDFLAIAYFYATLFVGTPPQPAAVITDTGSSLTAFPCAGCTTCGSHINPPYNPGQSSTVTVVPCGDPGGCSGCSTDGTPQCQYVQSYMEGSSIAGVLYRDVAYVGATGESQPSSHATYSLPQFAFGCHTREGGLFATQLADGIMGIGAGMRSYTRALWDGGVLDRYMFSLCLTHNGGAMSVGYVDHELHTGNAAPMWAALSLSDFYVVSVAGFALDSVALTTDGFNTGHTILDSGTTFTYLPGQAFAQLKSAINGYCRGSNDRCQGTSASVASESLCYNLADPSALNTFPSVTITLVGFNNGPPVPVTVAPAQVFLNMGWEHGAYCLSFYANNGGGAVFGANVLMAWDVIFDMGQVKPGVVIDPMDANPTGTPRVGFAPSTCTVTGDDVAPSSTAAPSSSGVTIDQIKSEVSTAAIWGGLAGAVILASTCACSVCILVYCCGSGVDVKIGRLRFTLSAARGYVHIVDDSTGPGSGGSGTTQPYTDSPHPRTRTSTGTSTATSPVAAAASGPQSTVVRVGTSNSATAAATAPRAQTTTKATTANTGAAVKPPTAIRAPASTNGSTAGSGGVSVSSGAVADRASAMLAAALDTPTTTTTTASPATPATAAAASAAKARATSAAATTAATATPIGAGAPATKAVPAPGVVTPVVKANPGTAATARPAADVTIAVKPEQSASR